MDAPMPRVQTCQSCSMPMENPEDFGTNHDNSRNADYCCFCFQNGRFSKPDITLEQMVDNVVKFMVTEMCMSEAAARTKMLGIIPKLKRWQFR